MIGSGRSDAHVTITGLGAQCGSDRVTRDEREFRPQRHRRRGAQQHGEEERAPCRRLPRAPEPAPPVRLEIRRDRRSLGLLGIEQAQVIVLKDALGYTFEEIAAAVGMPVGTAKCHAHRGRSRMREQLEDRDVA